MPHAAMSDTGARCALNKNRGAFELVPRSALRYFSRYCNRKLRRGGVGNLRKIIPCVGNADPRRAGPIHVACEFPFLSASKARMAPGPRRGREFLRGRSPVPRLALAAAGSSPRSRLARRAFQARTNTSLSCSAPRPCPRFAVQRRGRSVTLSSLPVGLTEERGHWTR